MGCNPTAQTLTDYGHATWIAGTPLTAAKTHKLRPLRKITAIPTCAAAAWPAATPRSLDPLMRRRARTLRAAYNAGPTPGPAARYNRLTLLTPAMGRSSVA